MVTILHELKLICPVCDSESLNLSTISDDIQCSNCGTIFPVNQGFLDLLPGNEAPGMIPSSNPMKWGWVVRIYNSRLWRRSRWLGGMFGISFSDEFNTIANAMNLEGNEAVLDLACGPGTYTLPLAEKLHNGFIIGVDLSIPMLRNASKQAMKESKDNVRFIHANTSNLPFLSGEFDVINCCGALHLFIEFLPSLLCNIHNMLKTNGRFTVAAALAPTGRIGKKLADRENRRGGLDYFTVESLTAYLEDSGFTEIRCLHAKRYWLIMSAMKP
ncbi:MAG: methyltransferase domain-containing protein [Candidatus Thorarchaeota archaeon]